MKYLIPLILIACALGCNQSQPPARQFDHPFDLVVTIDPLSSDALADGQTCTYVYTWIHVKVVYPNGTPVTGHRFRIEGAYTGDFQFTQCNEGWWSNGRSGPEMACPALGMFNGKRITRNPYNDKFSRYTDSQGVLHVKVGLMAEPGRVIPSAMEAEADFGFRLGDPDLAYHTASAGFFISAAASNTWGYIRNPDHSAVWAVDEDDAFWFANWPLPDRQWGSGFPFSSCPGGQTPETEALFVDDTAGCIPQCYGDFDSDSDVDLTDFGHFQGCFNGPNRPPPQSLCADADADADGDVDLADFGRFQRVFNGPNRPSADGCGSPWSDGDGFAAAESSSRQGTATVAAQDGDSPESADVMFDLQSPQAGQTISAGTPVEWHVFVSVTGDNQGLGGFNYSLFLGPNAGPDPGPDGRWGTRDDQNLADITLDTAYWAEAYAVAGANGKPTTGAWLTATGGAGGAGMNQGQSTGYTSKAGTLLQMGAGYLSWTPWHYRSTGKNPGWEGDHTWGVGLDARKETLLLDIDGTYELHVGSIDTTNLATGHYVLTLVPSDTVTVLRPDVDLSVSQPGGIVTYANSVSGPVSIEFDIGP